MLKRKEDLYINLFYSIIYELSKYQLFEPEIHMVDIILDSNNAPMFVVNEKYADVLDEIHFFLKAGSAPFQHFGLK